MDKDQEMHRLAHNSLAKGGGFGEEEEETACGTLSPLCGNA